MSNDVSFKLLEQYQQLQQSEHEIIVELLEILPKVDDLDPQLVGQVRDGLFHTDHPYLMVFIGPFSSGKSSLINALLGEDVLDIGVTPTTDHISILRYSETQQRMDSGQETDTVFYPSEMLKRVSFVDTPGLESVIQKHEEITRRFLHRADVVMMVMLATQAMSAHNLAYLQQLRTYGKKLIILINQADLLSDEEKQTVRQYVLDQSQSHLGFKPEVWLVSSKLGREANQGPRNDALWNESGIYRIEDYINQQLGDTERLKQKLTTPLHIVQNAHKQALNHVRVHQATVDHYKSISANMNEQMAVQEKNQRESLQEINQEIEKLFDETSQRGEKAIASIFRLSHAFRALGIGLSEMIGLARFFGNRKPKSYIKDAFREFEVNKPLDELLTTYSKLPTRLEGKDMYDVDALVQYAKREVVELPEDMQSRMIGTIQVPLKYDRQSLESIRPELEKLQDQAREDEAESVNQLFRDSAIFVAIWSVVIVILLIMWMIFGLNSENSTLAIVILVMLVLGFIVGMILMPIRGRLISRKYRNRLNEINEKFTQLIKEAGDKQIDYGMRMRQDAVSPLSNLVEAQSKLFDDQMSQLQRMNKDIVDVESKINQLGKLSIFGKTL
ncbi:dynamin family protein [Anaerolineales bacterium]